jgi:hypothetical protein
LVLRSVGIWVFMDHMLTYRNKVVWGVFSVLAFFVRRIHDVFV